MQTASILLSLGGDAGNQVPKYGVTAAEIAVLRAIHGDEAVTDILPLGEDSGRTNRAELARLRGIYGGAHDGEGNKVLDLLYPGAAARVFEDLDELELPRALFATKERVSSKATVEKAPVATKSTDLVALSPAKLKKLAKTENIDLAGATEKGAIIAAIEAARTAKTVPEAGDENSFDDLTDEELAELATDNDVDIEGISDRAAVIAKLVEAGVTADDDADDEIGVLG